MKRKTLLAIVVMGFALFLVGYRTHEYFGTDIQKVFNANAPSTPSGADFLLIGGAGERTSAEDEVACDCPACRLRQVLELERLLAQCRQSLEVESLLLHQAATIQSLDVDGQAKFSALTPSMAELYEFHRSQGELYSALFLLRADEFAQQLSRDSEVEDELGSIVQIGKRQE